MIHRESKNLLIDLFSHPDASVRRHSAERLSDLQSAIVSASLALALQDQDKGVRDAAARALLGMKSKSAAFAIAEYLVDSSFITRNLASNLLFQFGEVSIEPLLLYAVHENHDVRKLAIDTLGLIGHPSALPVLSTLIQDPDENVVLAVVEAFGNIKDPSVVPHLAMIYATNSYARTVVAEALGKIGHPSAVSFLLTQLLEHPAPEGEEQLIIFAVIEALASAGTPGAAEHLERLARSTTGKMRNIILYALVCIGERYEVPLHSYQSLTPFFREALSDDDTRIVITAVKALQSTSSDESENDVLRLLGRNAVLDQFILTNLRAGGTSLAAVAERFGSLTPEQRKAALEHLIPQMADLAASGAPDVVRSRERLFDAVEKEWMEADDDARIIFFDALFHLDEQRAVSYFQELIADPEYWMRSHALELLSQIGHYRSMEVLARFLEDPDEEVRSFVQYVLSSRGVIAESAQGEDTL